MQNNSKNTENNFAEWLEKKQEKDPTLRVIRQQDLVPMNDTTCKHEHLELDESEIDEMAYRYYKNYYSYEIENEFAIEDAVKTVIGDY